VESEEGARELKGAGSLPLTLATALFGCGNASRPSPEATPSSKPSAPASLVQARPYGLLVPQSYRAASRVVVLHGYGSNGRQQAEYFGLLADAEEHGYLLAYPDGLTDPRGSRFWNATDACCNFYAGGATGPARGTCGAAVPFLETSPH